jgi:hypothetical protein
VQSDGWEPVSSNRQSKPKNGEPDITGSIRPNLSQSTLARPRVLVAKWILALFMVCELCGALRARTAHQSLFIGYRKILAHARALGRAITPSHHQTIRLVPRQIVKIMPEHNHLAPFDSQNRSRFPKGTATQANLCADRE